MRRVREAVPDAHILVVDDNSPDGTAEKAEALGAELGGIEVLRRPSKMGLGSAYRAGHAVGIARGLRRDGPDRRRPLARPGRPPPPPGRGRAGRRPRARVALHAGRQRAQLAAAPARAVGARATATPRSASASTCATPRPATARTGRRSCAAIDFDTTHSTGYGFQIEMTYRVLNAGGQDRGDPDRVHRPRARQLEDVVAHRRRGDGSSSRGGACATACSGHVTRSRARST